MVNHYRDLLLNSTATRDSCKYVFVPPAFRKRNLPVVPTEIYDKIFAGCDTTELLDAKVSQLMVLLHASKFSEFLLEKDTRISYKLLGSVHTNLDGTVRPEDMYGIIYPHITTLIGLAGLRDDCIFCKTVTDDIVFLNRLAALMLLYLLAVEGCDELEEC